MKLLASCFLTLSSLFCVITFNNCLSDDSLKTLKSFSQIPTKTYSAEDKANSFFKDLQSYTNFLEPKTLFYNSNDEKLQLSDFRGEFVIIFFWASWCNSCIQTLQELEKLNNSLIYRNVKDVKIIPISIDFKSANEVMSKIKNHNISLEMYFDNKKSLMSSFGVKNVPMTFFINKKGEVICGFENIDFWNHNSFVQQFIDLKNASDLSETKSNDANISHPQKDDELNKERGIMGIQKNTNTIILD